MEDKAANGLREQQLRRKRINKMKASIITGLGIWILISTIVIITLLVKLFLLENKLDKLSESVISVEQVVENQNQKSAGSPEESAETSDTISGEETGTENSTGSEEELNTQMSDDSTAGAENEQDTSQTAEEKKKVYLTFDDGPSENTAKILDILKERNIKATFFVIGQEDEESKALYRRIVAEGHTLGMHSFTHKYNVIYESLDAFSEDMHHLQSYLAEVTGVTPTIMRFPGGSSNKVSNTDMAEFIRYLKEEGITYYDWNVASGDATSQAYTPDELVQNVMNDVVKYDTSIVLMHDSAAKATTVEALVPMIDQLEEMDVELLPIDENTKPIQQIPADSVE